MVRWTVVGFDEHFVVDQDGQYSGHESVGTFRKVRVFYVWKH